MGTLHEDHCTVHSWYIAAFFLEWEMFQTKVVDEIETHFVYNNFVPENCAVYEKISKNTVEPDRPQMTV